MARITLDFDDDLKRRAKAKAARERRGLSEVVGELLGRWVESGDTTNKRRRLRIGVHRLGTIGTLSRRELYKDHR